MKRWRDRDDFYIFEVWGSKWGININWALWDGFRWLPASKSCLVSCATAPPLLHSMICATSLRAIVPLLLHCRRGTKGPLVFRSCSLCIIGKSFEGRSLLRNPPRRFIWLRRDLPAYLWSKPPQMPALLWNILLFCLYTEGDLLLWCWEHCKSSQICPILNNCRYRLQDNFGFHYSINCSALLLFCPWRDFSWFSLFCCFKREAQLWVSCTPRAPIELYRDHSTTRRPRESRK